MVTEPAREHAEIHPAAAFQRAKLSIRQSAALDSRRIDGSPFKDAALLYRLMSEQGGYESVMDSLSAWADLKGVSRDGKRMIIQELAPKAAQRERTNLIAWASSATGYPMEYWRGKAAGMTNDMAREYLQNTIGEPGLDQVSGSLGWGTVKKVLDKLPLSAKDRTALEKNRSSFPRGR